MGRKVAGCVPLRKSPDSADWQVLLVRSRWQPDIWLFPKGGIDKGEKPLVAALRETREEAGVIGRSGPKLGSWTFSANGQHTKMWILWVSEEFGPGDKRYPEGGKRERRWVTFDDALALFKAVPKREQRPELVEILKKAKKRVKKVEEKEAAGHSPNAPEDSDAGSSDQDDSDDGE